MADKIYPAILPNTIAYDMGNGLYSPVNPHIDGYFHHRVAWYGKRNPQTATEWCDQATVISPYVVTSGNNTWGADALDEAQLFGADDVILLGTGTGYMAGGFDMMLTVSNSSITASRLRLVWGTGTLLASVALGQSSENMFVKPVAGVQIPRSISSPVIPFYIAGLPIKVWMQHWNASDDATIGFYIGVHGYTSE